MTAPVLTGRRDPLYTWRITANDKPGRPAAEHAVGRAGDAFCAQPAPAGWRWRTPDEGTRRCARCEVIASTEQVTPSMIVDATPLTYRQLDHWIRAGYLVPDVPSAGCGSQRVFSRAEFGVARRMARLVLAGVLPVAAERVARGIDLGPGISIRFDDEEDA